MTTSIARRLASLAALSTLCLSGLAMAQAAATGGPTAAESAAPGGKSAPAKEAIDACGGKAAGDKVQFTDAKGKNRKWVCVMVGDTLAARSGVATPAKAIKAKKAASAA